MRPLPPIDWSNHFKCRDRLWYALARVRLLPLVLVLIAACGRGAAGKPIQNLPLQWVGVERAPLASPPVARAFAAGPIGFVLRDLRSEPTAIGLYQRNAAVVRTTDNVGQYCTDRLADLLSNAGAHLNQGPGPSLEIELLEYKAVESGSYVGTANLRVNVRRAGAPPWTKTYEGTGKRRRNNDPASFNVVLSNALQNAISKLVADEDFARALMGEPPAQLQQPGQPRRAGG